MTTEEKLQLAIEALEEINNPIKAMQDRLQEGERLDGLYAYQMADSANYLKTIARGALNQIKEV